MKGFTLDETLKFLQTSVSNSPEEFATLCQHFQPVSIPLLENVKNQLSNAVIDDEDSSVSISDDWLGFMNGTRAKKTRIIILSLIVKRKGKDFYLIPR